MGSVECRYSGFDFFEFGLSRFDFFGRVAWGLGSLGLISLGFDPGFNFFEACVTCGLASLGLISLSLDSLGLISLGSGSLELAFSRYDFFGHVLPGVWGLWV